MPYNKCHTQIQEYFKNGYWSSKDFLDGMYLKFDKIIFVNKNIRIEKQLKIKCKFRGIIATYKIFKADSKIKAKLNNTTKSKSRFITFVTLGYQNNKMIDIVLWGCHKLAKCHCLSGEGIYEDDGHWIKVDKINYDLL